MGFRITTWNVNGIRNPFSYEPWRGTRTFESMFNILGSDIVVLQETKIQRKDLQDDMVLVPGWDCYFSLPKLKKGYSGVVIYTRNDTCTPIRAEEGITGVLCPPNSSVAFRDMPETQQIGGYPTSSQLTRCQGASEKSDSEDQDHRSATAGERIDATSLDSEGRCVVLEFPGFVLIGTYCPAYRDESRDAFRMDFLKALDARVRNLVSLGKRVFVTGDINISKAPIDSAHALDGIRKRTTTEEEFLSSPPRTLFNALLADGVVPGGRDGSREQPVLHDICRSFHPNRGGMYTCWDTKLNTRPGNYGSRIDYVLCSLDMKDWFVDSNIQEGLMGSDHCPVYAAFNDQVLSNGAIVHIRDIVNPPGMFKDGERQREYTSQYTLPTSGRLLPEFDVGKRRSIKDMFARKQPAASTSNVESTASPRNVDILPRAQGQNNTSSQLFKTTDTIASNPVTGKRTAPLSTSLSKRSKSTVTSSATSTSGQKVLSGFFKPRISDGNIKPELAVTTASFATMTPPESILQSSKNRSMDSTDTDPRGPGISNPGTNTTMSSKNSIPNAPETDRVIDPIVSKEDWAKLFTRKPVPRCDNHQEPCISMTTKKPGINCGRAFWICPRPLGPSGEKEKGTEWRCPTFIWASEWNGTMQPDPS
ncbi:hypothetical protein N7478_001597 [Penicillium angulare]|uniref:uncharacterized protein n=1 Tax=Penicillium angulare TaxID=116970 RepID=UPI002541900B|nr:uncharacterized protein N7478_001597 [Penicillium angulare]KAJ5288567.1 hypothetical protein N7478_001597 [Penicillium angulare]